MWPGEYESSDKAKDMIRMLRHDIDAWYDVSRLYAISLVGFAN